MLLVATLGGSVVQSNIVPVLSVAGVTPDVPLIIAVLVALRRGPETGCVVGFAAGLLQDAASGGLLGVQALTKALAGFATGLLVGRFWVTSPLVELPGIVLLTMAEGVARFFLLQFFHYPAALGPLMLHVIVPQALYNGCIGAACALVVAGAEAVGRRAWI
jgi:rod shape-determining protein MreD